MAIVILHLNWKFTNVLEKTTKEAYLEQQTLLFRQGCGVLFCFKKKNWEPATDVRKGKG